MKSSRSRSKRSKNGNPYLPGILGGIAAAALMLALLPFIRRWVNTGGSLYLIMKLIVLGAASMAVAKNLFGLLRARKGASAPDGFDWAVTGVTMVLLFVLLTVSSMIESPAQSVSRLTLAELEGHYEVEQIRGDDPSDPYLALMELSDDVRLQMDIDGEGYACFSYDGETIDLYRFHPDKMIYLVLEEGEETEQGGRFTLEDGMLTLNERFILRKIAGGGS